MKKGNGIIYKTHELFYQSAIILRIIFYKIMLEDFKDTKRLSLLSLTLLYFNNPDCMRSAHYFSRTLCKMYFPSQSHHCNFILSHGRRQIDQLEKWELNVESNQEFAGTQRFVIMIMKLFSRSIFSLFLSCEIVGSFSPTDEVLSDYKMRKGHEELRKLKVLIEPTVKINWLRSQSE